MHLCFIVIQVFGASFWNFVVWYVKQGELTVRIETVSLCFDRMHEKRIIKHDRMIGNFSEISDMLFDECLEVVWVFDPLNAPLIRRFQFRNCL